MAVFEPANLGSIGEYDNHGTIGVDVLVSIFSNWYYSGRIKNEPVFESRQPFLHESKNTVINKFHVN